MVFQAHDLFVAMGGPSDSTGADVAVDGGGAANDYLCQLLADLLRRTVVRPVLAEVTSIGAAKAALGGVGEEVPRYFAQDHSRATRFSPGSDPSYALEGYERWVELLKTLLA
jgi:glycerol kinase